MCRDRLCSCGVDAGSNNQIQVPRKRCPEHNVDRVWHHNPGGRFAPVSARLTRSTERQSCTAASAIPRNVLTIVSVPPWERWIKSTEIRLLPGSIRPSALERLTPSVDGRWAAPMKDYTNEREVVAASDKAPEGTTVSTATVDWNSVPQMTGAELKGQCFQFFNSPQTIDRGQYTALACAATGGE